MMTNNGLSAIRDAIVQVMYSLTDDELNALAMSSVHEDRAVVRALCVAA